MWNNKHTHYVMNRSLGKKILLLCRDTPPLVKYKYDSAGLENLIHYYQESVCSQMNTQLLLDPHEVNLYSSGDVTIPNNMTFTMDSDLNGKSSLFTLTCISTGGPATTVTWTRDSETVSGGMTALDDPVNATYTHTLTVTGRLGGQYQCTVSNNKSSDDSASLTVQGKRESKERAREGDCCMPPINMHVSYLIKVLSYGG